jgi:multidrug efflux pump subunit AcrA (membrane-fusion protein)
VSTPDLSKLTIDRGSKTFSPKRRPRWIKWAIAAGVVVVLVGFLAVRSSNAPATVEVAAVTSVFPSQGFTTLNATGRVSAWRKAAVSTKATGRLEWLGVQEGSRVKQGG